jgi:hypothetical protein
MKKIAFCLVLSLCLYACSTAPPSSEPSPSAAPPPPPPALPSQEPPKTAAPPSRTTALVLDGADAYTVVRGDTLSGISRKKYQNGFYYPLIMMASNGIVQDQDLIEPGMVFIIPKLQANLNDATARASMKKYFLEIAVITDRKRPADAAGLRSLANSW